MEAQSIVVIQDASREVNLKIFEWALNANGFSLKAGDKLTLVIVLHQVTTPMGYNISVDSRNMVGANQWVIEAEVAKKKEEYLNNEKLVQIFKIYKSKKVEFNIEVATGSSPKAVALKIAMKLKATWVILDRKMENDEEYFLRKLSCGLSRLRRYDRIMHLRGRPGLYKEKQDNTHEIYPESIPASTNSSNEQDPGSLEFFRTNWKKNQEQLQGQSNPHDGAAPAFYSNQTEETNSAQLNKDKIKTDQQHQDKEHKEIRPHGCKRDQKLKPKLEESEIYIACGGSNNGTQEKKSESTEVYQKSEEFICSGGAKNFYLGKAEEYAVCEKIFSLCNSFG